MLKATRPGRRAALYLRVSKSDQTTKNQELELRSAAKRMGIEVVHVYRDHGISGSKGREKRPQFDAMLKAAVRREIDLVMAWSVDRLGRSLQDLVACMNELRSVGCDLFLHRQSFDSSTPSGRAMFQMLGIFAEFEREIIRERINAGLARARAEGTKSGRPIGRPKVARHVIRDIERELRKPDGRRLGIHRIAKKHRCGVGTVQRVKAAMEAM